MELTSLGRAYLAREKGTHKTKLLEHFKQTRKAQWLHLKAEIETAEKQILQCGYCIASWQPEVVALATPIQIGAQIYALNVSVSSDEDIGALATELAPILMEIKTTIDTALHS